MKQTQTKLFEFSDVGLDFCSGSKNLFPDRFKKMLLLGYNVQTVSSVAVAGNQVTLMYGGAHGYVADRVLKVDSGALASINDGEFWIDSVTANTVTFTFDDAPSSVVGGFTTRIASLGWSLEYESGQVQIYKMKYLDERDLYVRFVFTAPSIVSKNIVTVCVGKTADLVAGIITDSNALAVGRDNTDIFAGFNWMFAGARNTTYDNYSYSQGHATFGRGIVVGSQYHLLIACATETTNNAPRLYAILPFSNFGFDSVDYPVIIGQYSTTALTSTGGSEANGQFAGSISTTFSNIMVGNVPLSFVSGTSATVFNGNQISRAAALPESVQGFNTTIAKPIQLYEVVSRHYLGEICAGLYQIHYGSGGAPSYSKTELPMQTLDYSNDVVCYLQGVWDAGYTNQASFFITPIEEIKVA